MSNMFHPEDCPRNAIDFSLSHVCLALTMSPPITGAVELWLLEVEAAIKRTLHKITGEALAAYARTTRSAWILQWPGQLVLNGSQVMVLLW